MIHVGITGGIGSGKTTVCKIFEMMGIPIYYADLEAKRLMTYDKSLKSEIKTLLGSDAYHSNGRLNRPLVASKIFTDKSLLEKLNELVHPAVRRDAKSWSHRQSSKYTIQEAALFVENGSYKSLDALIVVTAPEDTRIDRVVARDRVAASQVQQRIKNQLPESEKVKVADFVINNDGSQSLIPQVHAVHQKLMQL